MAQVRTALATGNVVPAFLVSTTSYPAVNLTQRYSTLVNSSNLAVGAASFIAAGGFVTGALAAAMGSVFSTVMLTPASVAPAVLGGATSSVAATVTPMLYPGVAPGATVSFTVTVTATTTSNATVPSPTGACARVAVGSALCVSPCV